MRCHVRTDNIIDPSLAFVENLEIYGRNLRPDIATILKAQRKGRLIICKNESKEKNKIQSRHSEPDFPAEVLAIDSIKSPHWKT